jgi:hypothetical protein
MALKTGDRLNLLREKLDHEDLQPDVDELTGIVKETRAGVDKVMDICALTCRKMPRIGNLVPFGKLFTNPSSCPFGISVE